jgi:hypothetical protein
MMVCPPADSPCRASSAASCRCLKLKFSFNVLGRAADPARVWVRGARAVTRA